MNNRQNISGLVLIISFAILTGLVSCESSETSPGTKGTEGNPCYQNGTCNAGLSCLSGYCVKVPQPDGGKSDGPLIDIAQADKSIMDVYTPPDRTKPDAPQVENTFQLCTDKKDNDGDGKIDCNDSDCWAFKVCADAGVPAPDSALVKPDSSSCTVEVCDGKDNDCDGKIDNGVCSIISSIGAPNANRLCDLSWDGTYLWVSAQVSYKAVFYQMDVSKKSVIKTVTYNPGTVFCPGVANLSNKNLLISTGNSSVLYEIDMSGTLKKTYFTGSSASMCAGLGILGNEVLMACYTDGIYSYTLGASSSNLFMACPGKSCQGMDYEKGYIFSSDVWSYNNYIYIVDYKTRSTLKTIPYPQTFSYNPSAAALGGDCLYVLDNGQKKIDKIQFTAACK